MLNKAIKSVLCLVLLCLSLSVMARNDAVQLSDGYKATGKIDHVEFSKSYIIISDMTYHLSPDFILVQAVGDGQQRLDPSSLRKGQWLGFNTVAGKTRSIRLIENAIVLPGKPDENEDDG